jgi:hypothetical protein
MFTQHEDVHFLIVECSECREQMPFIRDKATPAAIEEAKTNHRCMRGGD